MRLVLAIVLMAVVLLAREHLFVRNGATALVAVVAGALLVSQAWIGHPASLPGSERWLVTGAYAIHMLGAAVWLGALLPLGLLVARARRDGEGRGIAVFALWRFSRVGMIAVAAILLGGIVNAISRTDSFDALVASTWGQIVILKIAIISTMIVAAALNRFVLMPRLSAQTEITIARLARNVTFEQAAGLLILAAAAVLGVFHPPHF
ncbi:MAG: CopD family protein [Methylocystis sp.]|nr:CopD family protein [Methylocystis sp.]